MKIQNGKTKQLELEKKHSFRTLPIAAFSGIAISAFVFICMNVAYFSVLTIDQFKSSDAVAVVNSDFRNEKKQN